MLVDQYVFELKVSVGHFLLIHVLDRTQHLFKKVATAFFANASQQLTQVKHQPSRDKFQHNIDYACDFAAWRLDYSAGVTEFKDLNDIWVLEWLKNEHFIHNSRTCIFVIAAQEVLFEHFHSHLSLQVISYSLRQVHFRCVTFAQGT